MVGYGPEDNNFVVELTYNYRYKSNDFWMYNYRASVVVGYSVF
jgi:hypothetical protein